MRLIGIALVIGGWLVTIAGLIASSSMFVRGVVACIGIAISLAGSLGVLNSYYLARAIWKK